MAFHQQTHEGKETLLEQSLSQVQEAVDFTVMKDVAEGTNERRFMLTIG